MKTVTFFLFVLMLQSCGLAEMYVAERAKDLLDIDQSIKEQLAMNKASLLRTADAFDPTDTRTLLLHQRLKDQQNALVNEMTSRIKRGLPIKEKKYGSVLSALFREVHLLEQAILKEGCFKSSFPFELLFEFAQFIERVYVYEAYAAIFKRQFEV